MQGPAHDPCQRPRDPVSRDTGDWGVQALNCRASASDPQLLRREEQFLSNAAKAELPRYKCYYDKSLSVMWASPSKQAQLNRLGFIDQKGGIVDIHQKRR